MSVDVSNIKISTVPQSRIDTVDFDNIPFGKIFTDHLFKATYRGGCWVDMEITPVENFSLHPANQALHYGQSIFEGMKGAVDADGVPLLFRPREHAHRLNRSARRMCMPEFPEDFFIEVLKELVNLDRKWIPDRPGSALYIRPLMFAMDEFLRVSPSETFLFTIMLLPVGPYYGDAVKLWADTEFVRAVPGGTGEAKTAGNYAASLLPSRLAKEKGYDQILWLDGKQHKYVQEVGTMNIFFVFDDHIATPELDGGILAGITRDSFLTLLNDMDYTVRERPISIAEVMEKGQNGQLKEVFGSGTAAVANIVKEIRYKDTSVTFDPAKAEIAPMLKQKIEDIRHGRVEDKFDWIVRVD